MSKIADECKKILEDVEQAHARILQKYDDQILKVRQQTKETRELNELLKKEINKANE